MIVSNRRKEEPLLRVPSESMRKTFKSTQRHLERNIEVLNNTAQGLVNKLNSPNNVNGSGKEQSPASMEPSESATPLEGVESAEGVEGVDHVDLDAAVAAERATGQSQETSEVLGQIDTMIGRVKGLKRKISSLREEHEGHVGKAKARIEFLAKLYSDDMQSKSDTEPTESSDKYKEWTKTRLDMLLIDYCLRNGQPTTAEQLALTQGIEKLVDIEELKQCNEIERLLRVEHSTTKCQAWCQENRQFLKKTRSNLEFQIKLQQYIELCREQKFQEAIQYFRTNLIKNAETKLFLMQQAAALLTYAPEDTTVERYSEMYSPKRWQELADIFVKTFQELHGLPQRPLFLQYLATGITALKTHSCEVASEADLEMRDGDSFDITTPFSRKHKVDLTRGYMCPVCSMELRRIAQPLPYALHVHSHLEPDPVLLPNNRIYGLAKLLDYAKKAGVPEDKIVDPVTTEIFDRDSTTIVYPT